MLNPKNIVTVKTNQEVIFTAINLSNEALNSGRENWTYLWSIDTNDSPTISYTFNSLTNMRNVSVTFNGITELNNTIEIICRINIPTNTSNPVIDYRTKIKLVN